MAHDRRDGDSYTQLPRLHTVVTLERSPSGDDRLTGQCDHCEWTTVTTAYSELVKRYQDHLRERHPRVWLRD